MIRRAPASLRALGLAVCICLSFPAAAAAEWQFTPFIGYSFNGSTTLLDFGLVNNRTANDEPHLHFGGSVRLIGDGLLGLEGHFVYTPGFFESRQSNILVPAQILESRTYAAMGNIVLTTPRAWATRTGLRPSVFGGIGLIHAAARDQLAVFPYRLSLWGMNVGGDAVGFLTERIGVRFDVRYFRNIRGVPQDELEVPVTVGEPVRLRYWTASIGVVISRR